jgi:hypothetical protein
VCVSFAACTSGTSHAFCVTHIPCDNCNSDRRDSLEATLTHAICDSHTIRRKSRYFMIHTTFYSLEALRPLLKILKEIWETKVMAIWMIGIVHFSLPFGFRGLWNFLINGPPTPFKSLDTTVLLMLCMSLTAQLAVARLMWIWFRRAQTTLPLPWREFDMSDIFECVSAPTPLRGIHFLYLRRGSERRRVVRRTPWHFRHTLITAYYSIIAYSVIKFGRLSGVLVCRSPRADLRDLLAASSAGRCSVQTARSDHQDNPELPAKAPVRPSRSTTDVVFLCNLRITC